MAHGTQVGEIRQLLRRRTVKHLVQTYALEPSAASSAYDLIEAGLGEGPAVAEVLRVIETVGPDGVPDRVAEIVEWRANA
jgi:hypothetical protein